MPFRPARRAVAFAFVLVLLAGCVAPSRDAGAASPGAAGAYEPLSEPEFAAGELLSADVPSFDGVTIHVDVLLPDGEGPFPTLLEFTPYSSTLSPTDEAWANGVGSNGLADFYVPRGYAVGIAHVRGSGQSGGCFDVGGPNDARDGFALVEWVANQSWSSGRVALMGTSYVGTTPIATATLAPPHLTTIVPVSAVSEWYRYYFENGEPRFFGELPTGVVYTDHPLWAATGLLPKPRNPTAMDPVSNAQCGAAQMENAWLQDDYNEYWVARNDAKDVVNATAPMLYAHGFLDENTPTSLVTDFYDAYPGEKRLWMQQHGHGVPSSFEGYHEYVHRWLDHWMLGRENGALELAPVVLQDSEGEYHVEADWPPKNATPVLFHLGEGSLDEVPGADATWSYQAESANLTFLSEPLEVDLQIVGAPRVELVASSDEPDTQWDVQLFAVDESGWRFITRGYLDARHASSLESGSDLVPGEEDLFVVTMHGRDHRALAGQRLALVVASVDPYVVPDAPGATNTVRLGPTGSRLVLPVVEGVSFGDEPPTLGTPEP